MTIFLSLVILTVSTDAHNLPHRLHRRQVPAACSTSCAWIASLSECDVTDITCLCGVITGAGADVNACQTCLQTDDPDISSDIQEVTELCPSTGAPPVTGSSPTLSGTATGTSPTATGTDCADICAPIASAEATCTAGDSCLCPTVVAAGPACSQCLLTINATLASSVGAAISICNSEFPTATPTGGSLTACSSQCALINQALTACTDQSCFCTTLIGQGPACSQCYATVNVTEASVLSAALVTCQSMLPGVTGIPSGNNATQTAGLFPTATSAPTQSNSQVVTLAPATTSSHSAGMSGFDVIVGGSLVQWMTILALFGGMLGVFL